MLSRVGKKLKSSVSAFARNEDGAIKILMGLMAVPLLFAIGSAVDVAETHRARINFQNAVDAAALQVGRAKLRGKTNDEAKQLGRAMFYANMHNLNAGLDPNGDSRASIDFDVPPSCNSGPPITATAQLEHDLFFGGTRRAANWWYGESREEYNEVNFSGRAEVRCGGDSWEIALVLDNSGSMAYNGKIGTLRVAAKQLVNNLHDAFNASIAPDLMQFSLVPFSTFVNIGPGNRTQNWMDRQGASSIHHEHFNWDDHPGATPVGSPLKTDSGISQRYRDSAGNFLTRFSLYDQLPNINWAGCVEMRPFPHHTLDSEPSVANPDTLFVPQFAPDTPDNWSGKARYEQQTISSIPYCVRWRSDGRCRRWSDGQSGQRHPGTNANAYYYSYDYQYEGRWRYANNNGVYWNQINSTSEESYQNNYLRDDHNVPAATNDFHPYSKDHIGTGENQYKRQAWTWKYFNNPTPRDVNNNQSGLPSVVGFEGGPNAWCTSAPILPLTNDRQATLDAIDAMQATGSTNVPQGFAWGWRTLSKGLPFDEGRSYNTQDNNKVLIVMTDGNNTYYPIRQFYGNSYSGRNGSYYGAFAHSTNRREDFEQSRIFDGFTDIANPQHDFATFTKAMDSHLQKTCANAKEVGIRVYSIAFDVPNGSSVKEMLEYCASTDGDGSKLYYDASNNAELLAAFEDIGDKLTDLRLTK